MQRQKQIQYNIFKTLLWLPNHSLTNCEVYVELSRKQ